jgi:hypothetical protein
MYEDRLTDKARLGALRDYAGMPKKEHGYQRLPLEGRHVRAKEDVWPSWSYTKRKE